LATAPLVSCRPVLINRDPIGKVGAVVDDDVLVARLAAGDDDALGELFDRYAPFVLGLASRVAGNAGSAEDVVQEVFAALWAHPDRFDAARGSLRAYLGVQAYRRAVDTLRRDGRRRAREENCATFGLGEVRFTPDGTEAASVAEVVRQAISRLPDEQRLAVELVFWHGYTYREVATILAVPEGTAKSRLRLAQAKLADWLTPLKGEPV
jgi:RNA polymerase sigma-70 factor (ECF subfamily)